MGSKSGARGIVEAKIAQEAGKAPPRGRGPQPFVTPVTRFGQKMKILTLIPAYHFGTFFLKFWVPFLSRFLVAFGADLDPI